MPRPRPLELAPVAGLTRLLSLTLVNEVNPDCAGRCVIDAYSGTDEQELLRLSTLTALESLQLRMSLTVSVLPPLPALRVLVTGGGLQVSVLAQVPQLTRLEACVLRLPATSAARPVAPLLRSAAVADLHGLAVVAPQLQQLTFRELPLTPSTCDLTRLSQAQRGQLCSLQLPEYATSGISARIAAQLASSVTRLVLTHFDCNAASSLALCRRGVRELDLSFCKGWEACKDGSCRLPPSVDNAIYDDEEEEAGERGAFWLAAMRGSGVADLTLRYGGSEWFEWSWLQPLARWRSLQRLVLDGGVKHSKCCRPRDLSGLAAACLREGSPLSRLELRAGKFWVRQRQLVCAAVERANPRITCTAPVVAM